MLKAPKLVATVDAGGHKEIVGHKECSRFASLCYQPRALCKKSGVVSGNMIDKGKR